MAGWILKEITYSYVYEYTSKNYACKMKKKKYESLLCTKKSKLLFFLIVSEEFISPLRSIAPLVTP